LAIAARRAGHSAAAFAVTCGTRVGSYLLVIILLAINE
jgi:hypothetical protein